MGLETGADTRPTVPVRRDLGALAIDVFVATQRASMALAAAEQLNFRHPTRGNVMAITEARREVQALAEAHALMKALAPYAEALAEGLPGVFVEDPFGLATYPVPSVTVDYTPMPSGHVEPAGPDLRLAVIKGGRA